MLEVKNIHAAYGKVNVLRGIDLHLEEGEIVAVLGSCLLYTSDAADE